MSNCACIECCEFRLASDEDLACAQMFDYAVGLHQRARKDWEQSTTRLKAAITARDRVHQTNPRPQGHQRTEQQ